MLPCRGIQVGLHLEDWQLGKKKGGGKLPGSGISGVREVGENPSLPAVEGRGCFSAPCAWSGQTLVYPGTSVSPLSASDPLPVSACSAVIISASFPKPVPVCRLRSGSRHKETNTLLSMGVLEPTATVLGMLLLIQLQIQLCTEEPRHSPLLSIRESNSHHRRTEDPLP